MQLNPIATVIVQAASRMGLRELAWLVYCSELKSLGYITFTIFRMTRQTAAFSAEAPSSRRVASYIGVFDQYNRLW